MALKRSKSHADFLIHSAESILVQTAYLKNKHYANFSLFPFSSFAVPAKNLLEHLNFSICIV